MVVNLSEGLTARPWEENSRDLKKLELTANEQVDVKTCKLAEKANCLRKIIFFKIHLCKVQKLLEEY